MKFRWSDGYTFAVEFECERENDFYPAAVAALAEARQRKIKRYHQPGAGTHIYYPLLQLHVRGVDGTWLNSSPSTRIYADDMDIDDTSVNSISLRDESWLHVNSSSIWALCERTYIAQAVKQFEKIVSKNTGEN